MSSGKRIKKREAFSKGLDEDFRSTNYSGSSPFRKFSLGLLNKVSANGSPAKTSLAFQIPFQVPGRKIQTRPIELPSRKGCSSAMGNLLNQDPEFPATKTNFDLKHMSAKPHFSGSQSFRTPRVRRPFSIYESKEERNSPDQHQQSSGPSYVPQRRVPLFSMGNPLRPTSIYSQSGHFTIHNPEKQKRIIENEQESKGAYLFEESNGISEFEKSHRRMIKTTMGRLSQSIKRKTQSQSASKQQKLFIRNQNALDSKNILSKTVFDRQKEEKLETIQAQSLLKLAPRIIQEDPEKMSNRMHIKKARVMSYLGLNQITNPEDNTKNSVSILNNEPQVDENEQRARKMKKKVRGLSIPGLNEAQQGQMRHQSIISVVKYDNSSCFGAQLQYCFVERPKTTRLLSKEEIKQQLNLFTIGIRKKLSLPEKFMFLYGLDGKSIENIYIVSQNEPVLIISASPIGNDFNHEKLDNTERKASGFVVQLAKLVARLRLYWVTSDEPKNKRAQSREDYISQNFGRLVTQLTKEVTESSRSSKSSAMTSDQIKDLYLRYKKGDTSTRELEKLLKRSRKPQDYHFKEEETTNQEKNNTFKFFQGVSRYYKSELNDQSYSFIMDDLEHENDDINEIVKEFKNGKLVKAKDGGSKMKNLKLVSAYIRELFSKKGYEEVEVRLQKPGDSENSKKARNLEIDLEEAPMKKNSRVEKPKKDFVKMNSAQLSTPKEVIKGVTKENKELFLQNIPKLQVESKLTRKELHSFYILYKALCVVTSQRYDSQSYSKQNEKGRSERGDLRERQTRKWDLTTTLSKMEFSKYLSSLTKSPKEFSTKSTTTTQVNSL